MSQEKDHNLNRDQSWRTTIGEREGVFDRRVELVSYQHTLETLLHNTDEELQSAFPTIAQTELRPQIVRALEVVTLLTSDIELEATIIQTLEEELGLLDLNMTRLMRANYLQADNVKINTIFGDSRTASRDHTTVIPENWQQKPQ